MEIVTHEAVGHTLFDPDALINHNDGEVISLTQKGIRGHYALQFLYILLFSTRYRLHMMSSTK